MKSNSKVRDTYIIARSEYLHKIIWRNNNNYVIDD